MEHHIPPTILINAAKQYTAPTAARPSNNIFKLFTARPPASTRSTHRRTRTMRIRIRERPGTSPRIPPAKDLQSVRQIHLPLRGEGEIAQQVLRRIGRIEDVLHEPAELYLRKGGFVAVFVPLDVRPIVLDPADAVGISAILSPIGVVSCLKSGSR